MAPTVVSFARSAEIDPERRVARLYLALFDRAPDRSGFDFWVEEFETSRRTLPNISEQFVRSPEFLARFGALDHREFVVLVYNRVLARQPDVTGFRYWVARLDGGMSRGELISRFAEAPEFVQKSRPAVDLVVLCDGLLVRPPS
jgi:hypothetical protein